MNKGERFHYNILQEYNENKYKERLTASHIISDKIPLKIGSEWSREQLKEVPTYINIYVLWKERKKYALLSSEIDKLPIIVQKSREIRQGKDVYELIERYASVRPQPNKLMDFRELVDTLCSFEHSSKLDFTLWKICALSSMISRAVFRVSTEPAFGKDSVVTCLGELLGDVANLNKPTVAKLEYELTNKLILMNELGTLSGEARQKMEDFLLNIGDMKNKYKKSSRAGKGTLEEYDISEMSLILAFNNIDCYPDHEKYFDYVFSKAVYDRYIPFKFQGKIVERIKTPLFAHTLMESYKPFYEEYIRSVMWYSKNYEREAMDKKFTTTTADEYPLPARWQRNLNTFIIFIHLYAKTSQEAQQLLDELMVRHKNYISMVQSWNGGDEAVVTEQKLQF